MTVPYWKWSAADLAKAIRQGSVSSQEVVQAHLERIETVNPAVNAVTVVLSNGAISAAKAADEKAASGQTLARLHGVPISIKENIDIAGSATTHGIASLHGEIAATDAPVIAHLRRAGAIPIARTNLPDFGLRWHTDNDLHGATRNPWDASRTPGGSSGGEAAAIATGMSPLGIGNDMGGSLRYPSQCCGVTAVKPSLGRVSRTITSMFNDPPTFYEQVACVNGPVARHVRDLRLALDIMSQPDPADPCWTAAPRLGSSMPAPVRVAVSDDPSGSGGSATVAQGIRKAADILANAGYQVEQVAAPHIADSTNVIHQIADTEIKRYLPTILPMMSKDGRTVLERLVGDEPADLSHYTNAIAQRYRIASAWNLFMEQHSLVLGPVSAMLPFEVGYDVAGPELLETFVRSMALTEICNLLGLPSIAVPVGVVDGLPQAVQLIGPRFHEDLCFDAADTIEQHCGVITPVDPVIS